MIWGWMIGLNGLFYIVDGRNAGGMLSGHEPPYPRVINDGDHQAVGFQRVDRFFVQT